MDQFFYAYREHRFNRKSQAQLAQANAILDEMREQGYVLTLRQLFYQFVRRDLIPNSEKEYKKLGRLVTDARESGQMDWLAIEDRNRSPNGPGASQTDEQEALLGVEHGVYVNPWDDQDHHIEVWVEKDALSGVISRPCNHLHITHMACRGYLSASEAWRAGLRMRDAIDREKTPVLIHLADHDPSGLDMTRDNETRLEMFAEMGVEVRRIALNMDQVEQYAPPPNPAKITDSRAKGYISRFGNKSWELDALEPKVLDDLIADTIKGYIDGDKWKASREREREMQVALKALYENWPIVRHELKARELF